MLFLKGNEMERNSKELKPLVVLFPFPEQGNSRELLEGSAEILRKTGQKVALLFRDTLPEEEKSPCRLLAFAKEIQETGQLALKAAALGLSGDVVYGGTDLGISLERGNVITTFGQDHFRSTFVHTEAWAFPAAGDRDLSRSLENPIIRKTLFQVYTGLMIHALGRADSFLSAMDEARRLWRRNGD